MDLVEFYTSAQTSLSRRTPISCLVLRPLLGIAITIQRAAVSNQVQTFIDGKSSTPAPSVFQCGKDGCDVAGRNQHQGLPDAIRRIFRSVDNDPDVIFIGRCDQASDIGNDSVSITAKQDLGNIGSQPAISCVFKDLSGSRGFNRGRSAWRGGSVGFKRCCISGSLNL